MRASSRPEVSPGPARSPAGVATVDPPPEAPVDPAPVDPAPDVSTPPVTAATELREEIRQGVVLVVAASRVVTVVMVALGALAGIEAGAYSRPVPAVSVYAVVSIWGLGFVALAVRRAPIPRWAVAADVAVVAVAAGVLPWFGRTAAFEVVANPDLEPVSVSVAVAVGLIMGSGRAVTAACGAMGTAYLLALAPFGFDVGHLASAVNVGAWQAGAGFCAWVLVRRLRDAAAVAEAATAQVVAARELLAAQRAHADERLRQSRDRVRRYRALHDGPLRILTAVAGPGPVGHPDPRIRRQCAISANLLRGTTSDDDGVPLTELSLALVEAGDEIAAHGLRVHYHLAALPEGVPGPVVNALRAACAEALHNVHRHAGVTRAWLTATTGDRGRPAVRVAVVDQGAGFDLAAIPDGQGLRRSIVARLAEVGGRASITSHPGEGTRIDLTWPT